MSPAQLACAKSIERRTHKSLSSSSCVSSEKSRSRVDVTYDVPGNMSVVTGMLKAMWGCSWWRIKLILYWKSQSLHRVVFAILDRGAIRAVQHAVPYPLCPPALSTEVDKLKTLVISPMRKTKLSRWMSKNYRLTDRSVFNCNASYRIWLFQKHCHLYL